MEHRRASCDKPTILEGPHLFHSPAREVGGLLGAAGLLPCAAGCPDLGASGAPGAGIHSRVRKKPVKRISASLQLVVV